MFHYSLDISGESELFSRIVTVMNDVGRNIKVVPLEVDIEDGNLIFTIMNLSGSDLTRIGVEMMLSNAGRIIREAMSYEGPVFMGRTEIRPFDEDEYDDLVDRLMMAEDEPARMKGILGRDTALAGI